jgi:uracil-DNA glycosylase family 4
LNDPAPPKVTEAWLMKEFSKRARACGLEIDCLGTGNLKSEIVIIGEAPGEREAIMKMPLVGGSGKLLWDCLAPLNINRTDCYITNVVKRQVSLSTKTDARNPVKMIEIEHWEGLLEWELDQLPNVKYVLALGNFALHALTGDTGITNWRGSVVDCKIGRRQRVVKLIVTNNPAHILRSINLELFYKFDLAKLRRVIDGKFKRYTIDATINPTFDNAMQYIGELDGSDKPIAFDIEVIANETACIGFANSPNEGICINFRDGGSNRFSLQEEGVLRRRLQELFQNKKNKFIAQNGSFDCGWLWYKDRIHVPEVWFDTLLAHHTLYPRFPHNLGFLTSQYTDHPYYKDEGKTWREGGNINQFWEYNVKDCCITWAVHKSLQKELKEQEMDTFFFDHVMRLQPHLIAMQVGGIKADISLKDEISKELEKDLHEKLDKFWKHTRKLVKDPTYSPNPKSPKQLGDLLFNRLRLVGRGISTDKDNRERMRLHKNTTDEQIELLDLVDDYLKESKFYSTYATQKTDGDNRIRCEYKQFGTQSAPGRLSSSGTLWGSGMNLQNQPQRAYPMFLADEGYMLSYFDLKQAEAKIVAYQWKVRGLIETFEKAGTLDNYDVHRGNASLIFHEPYDKVPKNDRDKNGEPTIRYLGKRCVHGLNYRMQALKLADVCGIPLEQAKEAFYSYHRAFPEIQKAWTDIIRTVKDDRVLFTPLGRRMVFLERITEDSLDSVIAFVPQSTIGDKVSSVIYQCHEDPEWPRDARMLLNIHDALISIHKPEDKRTVQSIMKKHAEAPITIRGTQVSIDTDFKESVPDERGIHRWSTLKELS